MSERGSVFLETIVAAAILAAILGVVFDALHDAAQRTRRATMQEQALLIAQSKLAAYPLTVPARGDRTSGSEGPFRWTVDVAPDRRGEAFAGLMRVQVRVEDSADRRIGVTLASLRPGAAR